MRSLLHKLLLSSLLIILLPMGLAILWSSKTLTTVLERRFAEKSRAQAEQVELLLGERKETATGLVHWIAEMPGVRDALKTNDRARLFQHLLPHVGSIQLDFIEILDSAGRIFLRVHDPTRYGDRPKLTRDIQQLLRGTGDFANYGVEEREGKAYLRAVETIDGDRTLGIVSAGYALNRDLIKKLEQVAGGKVFVAIGSRTYSADRPGQQSKPLAPISTVAANDRESLWHRNIPSPSLEIRLPLITDRGTEGSISIFYPSQEMTATINTLQRTLAFVALVGIALALAASWFMSRRLTRPLKELVSRTQQVGAGNYEGAVSTQSGDEIGALAASFNCMLEELRRSKAEVEGYRGELERKVAERSEQLNETEKKRAAMAHMIAHDLVIGMVNEMLDLYRSDFGDIPLSRSAFRVEEIIQTSLRILGPDLEEKAIQVPIYSNPEHISVVADKRRLSRLLINLLSNAIKFSPERSRISIYAAVREQNGSGFRVELRVEDEGVGIPERDLPRIFDRFYSQDKAEAGTGLGLPYCKLVAEAHGGSISAENRKHGGFSVSVLLPMQAWETEGFHAA